ncbi:MAG TPA: LysR family transcriptional regulator [Gammaproteobacteria bacterium]|nr:LysR family transcriptional regulator [Gammaproteobacteria bacterium]
MKFTLRQIQVFLATAHFENISRAADSLSMSQSAASSALAELESQFDIKLFDRVGKRLQLNALGHALRGQSEALLRQAEDLEVALQQHSAIGHLKVGATLTIGNYLAVHIMSRFLQDKPEARVELDVANTASIARKVKNFELDVGLIEGELSDPELDITPWMKDELVAFCAPEHPYADKKKLTDQDILAANWILREQGSGTRQTFDWAMHGVLPQLTVLLELQHTEAIKRAVEAGLGIGCLSRVALKEAFARVSLVPLPMPQRNLKREFYFILHRQKYRNSSIDAWLALCLELFH